MSAGFVNRHRRYVMNNETTISEIAGRKGPGICPMITTSPPSFVATEELQNRLRQAENLTQIEVAKNRRR